MQNGKGSKARPIFDRKRYDSEFDRIFKHNSSINKNTKEERKTIKNEANKNNNS